MKTLRNWFGLRCRLKHCPCRQVDTEYGISGMCVDCGKVVGFVSRKELRAYLDRQPNK